MKLTCQRSVTAAVRPSPNVMQVAAMFGLGIDEERTIELIPPTDIPVDPHSVVFVTGASGSGKSTLLNLIDDALRPDGDIPFMRFDDPDKPPDVPLVDCFGDAPLERILHWLSLAGLNDAFVMLRRWAELSDGQRYRFQLAQCMARVTSLSLDPEQSPSKPTPLAVVLADEFAATLDRLTAAVLARNVRKWVNRTPVCFIAATTHDDLLEPFAPDVLVEKHLGQRIEVVTRAD